MKRKLIIFIALAVVFIILATTVTFFITSECGNFECFQEAMKKCDRVKYVNEQTEATWRYEILKFEKEQCKIEVTLLQPKAGELGIEKLIGHKMVCGYPKGISTYPEGNLERCHGRLKEELQSLAIKKLHTFIIENIGEIEEGLDFFVSQP